jgi:hypothetical protein
VSENPFAPPERFEGLPPHGHRPGRRRWSSPAIIAVGLAVGLLLGAVTTAGALVLVGIARSTPSGGAAQTQDSPAPLPTPGSGGSGGSGSRAVSIDFPDGTTGRFTVPAGLHHQPDEDDAGHIALAADDGGAAYLDLYTDETTASKAHDLARTAAQEATDDRNHGDTTGSISIHTVGGHRAAQYRLTRHDGNGSFDALVTVVLIGHEDIGLYWSDDAQHFTAAGAQAAEAALLRSMRVTSGSGDGATPAVSTSR